MELCQSAFNYKVLKFMKAKQENIENKLVAKLNCTDFQYSLTSNKTQYDLQILMLKYLN